jgi:hypothetical protein
MLGGAGGQLGVPAAPCVARGDLRGHRACLAGGRDHASRLSVRWCELSDGVLALIMALSVRGVPRFGSLPLRSQPSGSVLGF